MLIIFRYRCLYVIFKLCVIGLCKTSEESELFMAIPLNSQQEEVRNKYSRLEILVGLKFVEIVAHPHSQYVSKHLYKASLQEEDLRISNFKFKLSTGSQQVMGGFSLARLAQIFGSL